MNDVRKPSKLPPGARRRSGRFPGEELRKACNKLYYGDESISEPPGKSSMFRAVVAVGAVLTVPDPLGDPIIVCGGTWTIDPSEPEYTKAIVEYLRSIADELEREAGS